ncbi:cytochrome P450 [Xylaria bambusicola]|uniref:cytochrome P450 n=1 Tax=Xylaria bambusicola TaxID=326684 RepID=UPI002007F09B|nr:cytochrome P450 [Xylaria bambusicola]KAI0508825.1 cytochrome P450 [Xylaria bambusicola]
MLFYALAPRPELQMQLRDEIKTAGIITLLNDEERVLTEGVAAERLGNLVLMDACINETMRLYPSIPSGGARQTTSTRIQIGNHWIPPDTVVVAPRWSIGRLESAFEKATEFIPERWTTMPHMVQDTRAFNPFSMGRHSCPGKQLGLFEIRIVAVMILANFTFTFAPGKKSS